MFTPQERLALAFIFAFTSILPVHAQGPLFELVSDARRAALGFNSAGGMVDGYSLRSQPSYFPLQNITEISYGSRSLSWIKSFDAGWWYTSLSVPIDEHQSFALFYHRFDFGSLNITDASPQIIGTLKPYELVFGGAYNRELIDGLNLGIAFKYYYQNENSSYIVSNPKYHNQTAKAYVGDLGLTYSQNLINSESLRGGLSFSSSITNLGTWIEASDGSILQVPRSLLLGVTYNQQFLNPNKWQRLNGLLALQYRGVLNNVYQDRRDYWNFGAELDYADIAFLRIGISILPFSSIFGNKGQGAVSYGFGINVPMDELSSSFSAVALKFDYAAIPFDSEIISGFLTSGGSRYNRIYTFRVGYDFSLSDLY